MLYEFCLQGKYCQKLHRIQNNADFDCGCFDTDSIISVYQRNRRRCIGFGYNSSYLGDDGYYTFHNVEEGDILYSYYPYDDTDVLYNNFRVPFNKNVYTYNEEDGAYYYTVNLDLIYTITINITNIDYIKELMGYECNININATFNGNYLHQFNEIDFNNFKGVKFQLSKNEINKVLQIDINIEVGISNRYLSYTVRKVTQEDIDADKIDLELIFIELGY